MKQGIKQFVLFFMLLNFSFASSGAILYSHYCATSNETYIGYVKEHCQMEVEQPSCHKTQDEAPCCTDNSTFDTQDQYVSQLEKPIFLTPALSGKLFIPVVNSQFDKVTTTNVDLYPRPPNLRACIRFQQILC